MGASKARVACADLTNNKIYFVNTGTNTVAENFTCTNGCNFLAYDAVNDLLYTAKTTYLTRINTANLASLSANYYNILTAGTARGICVDDDGSVYVNCNGYVYKVLYNGITVNASRITIADGYNYGISYSIIDKRIRPVFMNYASGIYLTCIYMLDKTMACRDAKDFLTYYGYGVFEDVTTFGFYLIMNTGGSGLLCRYNIYKP